MVPLKMSLGLAAWLLVLLMALVGPIFVCGEPDPMARPTRPKVFTSPEELRRYLDSVKDYYSMTGKGRYGKRSRVPSSADYVWDTVRIPQAQTALLALRQQEQQLQPLEMKEFLRQQQEELEPRLQQLIERQTFPGEIFAKYYDELQ